MLMSIAVKAPNIPGRVALRMLQEAVRAAEKEEWDHAHWYATDALIWLEACYPDEEDN